MILDFKLHTLLREKFSLVVCCSWRCLSAKKTVKAVVYVVMDVLFEGIEETGNCRNITLGTFFG